MDKHKQLAIQKIAKIALVVFVVAILGALTYRLVDSTVVSEDADNNNVTNTTQTEDGLPDLGDNIIEMGEIAEPSSAVELYETENLGKLPAGTPEHFVRHMRDLLAVNVADQNGCNALYSVSKVSAVNVLGKMTTVKARNGKSEEPCKGEKTIVWSYGDDIWAELSFTETPSCDAIERGKIYSEFVPECAFEGNATDIRDNPNGSIKDAKDA